MQTVFRLFVSIVIFLLASNVSHAQSDYVAEIDYLKRQTVSERLQALGDDLLGDSIDLNTGSINIEHVDVSLPGNSSLEVAVRRSRTTGFPFPHLDAASQSMMASSANDVNRPLVTSPFSDWAIEVPRISSLVPGSVDPTGQVGEPEYSEVGACIPDATPLITAFKPGPIEYIEIDGPNMAVLEYSDYSDGLSLHIPGGGTQKILNEPTGVSWSSGTDYVTKSNWIIKCNGSAAIARSPTGVTYKFNLRRFRHAPAVPVSGRIFNPNWDRYDQWNTVVARVEANMLATEVTDVNGNWVKYEYTPTGWPKRIHSNDGREITITYNSSDLITSVTANGRVWNYSYKNTPSGHTLLDEVTLPDNRKWQFDLTHYVVTPNADYDCESPDASWTMTHPSGVEGTFVFSETKHPKGYSPREVGNAKSCSGGPFISAGSYDAMSVISKSLSGPSYPEAEWTYNYGGIEGKKWGEIINPLGHRNRTTYHHSDDITLEGLPYKSEAYAASGSLLRRTTYEHFVENVVGITGLQGIVNDSPHKFARPRHTIKTTTTMDGDTFTSEVSYNTDQTSSTYSYGNPTQTKTYSNVSTTPRIMDTTYEHNTDKWILGLPKTVTRGDGVQMASYNYDNYGRKISQTRYGQLAASFAYHSDGTMASVKDALNRTTTADNWHRGAPQLVTRAVGTALQHSSSSTIDDNGWVTSQTDAKGNVTSYAHDTMGRLTLIDPPANFDDTSIAYDFSGGGAVQTITKGQSKSTITYDGMFRPTLERTQALDTGWFSYVNTEYDALGRVSFKSFPSSNAYNTDGSNYLYDGLGRPLSTIQTVSPYAATQTEYLSEHAVRVTDPEGNATTTYKDGFGDIIRIEQPEDTTTLINRDPWGQIFEVRQMGEHNGINLSKVQKYHYDDQQRLCHYQTPSGNSQLFAYNAAGERIAESSGHVNITGCAAPNGTYLASHSYDALGRLAYTDFAEPGTASIGRAYDANSNLVALYQEDNNADEIPWFQDDMRVAWRYAYDAMNNLTVERLWMDGRVFAQLHSYNSDGSMATSYREYRHEAWGGQRYAYTYSYNRDGLGRGQSLSMFGQGGAVGSLASGAAYHPSGALTALHYANGQTFTKTLNNRLLPETLITTGAAGTALDLQYTYNPRGLVSGMIDGVNASNNRAYDYDAQGRLILATGPWGANGGAASATYSYDSLGNIRHKTLGPRSVTLAYDDTSNRLTRAIDSGASGNRVVLYDSRGNVRKLGDQRFRYNGLNRPTGLSGAVAGAHRYDAHGRRVKTIIRKDSGNTIRYNVYGAAGDLVFNVQIDHSAANEDYVTQYARMDGQTLARVKSTGGPANYTDTVTYLHNDHLGSAGSGTADDGHVAWREEYSPFGITRLNDAANDNQAGFTGHIKDSDTGLTYMQARYYDPVIGRFLSVDPVGFMVSRPGQFNRYSYCYNDPVNCTDPTGMLPPEGTVSGELFSGHSLEHAQGISDAFAPASEAGFKGMVTGVSLTPLGRGATAGVGLGARALGAAALRRGASRSYAGAAKYINSVTSAGRATKGVASQRVGTGGRSGAEKLFKTLTGQKGQLNSSKTVTGALKDGNAANIRSTVLKDGTKRTTVEVQRKVSQTGSRIKRVQRVKVRFDE